MAYLDLHLLAQFLVKRRQRLVHEQDARFENDRARQRNALLLAAGKLIDLPIAETAELDDVEGSAHALLGLSPGNPAQLQRIGKVAGHRHVREQGIILEHHAEVALVGRRQRDIGVPEDDLAGIGPYEPGKDHQKGRLAGTRWTEQRQEFAACYIDADIIERFESAVGLCDIANRDRQRDLTHAASGRFEDHPSPKCIFDSKAATTDNPSCGGRNSDYYSCRNASKRLTISSVFFTHQSTDKTKPFLIFSGEFGSSAIFSFEIRPVSNALVFAGA